MIDRQILLNEAAKAIAAYGSNRLSLSGLVNRLESVKDALTEGGVEFSEEVDKDLLQLEIINSLIASGDNASLSEQDLTDIGAYLRHITDEFRRVDQA
jgi:hypothetical protein